MLAELASFFQSLQRETEESQLSPILTAPKTLPPVVVEKKKSAPNPLQKRPDSMPTLEPPTIFTNSHQNSNYVSIFSKLFTFLKSLS